MVIFQELQMARKLKVVIEYCKILTTKGDQGEQHQVPGHIYFPQEVSMGKLMTPLRRRYLTEIMKNILKHAMMQCTKTIIKYKMKCQTRSHS